MSFKPLLIISGVVLLATIIAGYGYKITTARPTVRPIPLTTTKATEKPSRGPSVCNSDSECPINWKCGLIYTVNIKHCYQPLSYQPHQKPATYYPIPAKEPEVIYPLPPKNPEPLYPQPPKHPEPLYPQPPKHTEPLYPQPPKHTEPLYPQPPKHTEPLYPQPPKHPEPLYPQPPKQQEPLYPLAPAISPLFDCTLHGCSGPEMRCDTHTKDCVQEIILNY